MKKSLLHNKEKQASCTRRKNITCIFRQKVLNSSYFRMHINLCANYIILEGALDTHKSDKMSQVCN